MPLSFALLCTLSLGVSIGHSQSTTVEHARANDLLFFESKIRPLLVEQCFECHAQTSEASGGLVLDSQQAMIRGGDSGPAIDLENPDASLLLRAIGYRDPKLQMPPDGKLTEAQIEYLRQWIATGATSPKEFSQGNNPSRPAATALSVERSREHWAYCPISDPPIPDVFPLDGSEDPPESPIDAFLLRLQRASEVRASDRVDFSTWLRRLSIDLHGLNPTYEDLQYWTSHDQSSDAADRMLLRERLLDSMLASPRFGERFARHWMDIVRYAESLTLRGFLLADAWRYRNYLIDAFNSDMPFGQFVTEQIAGDLLPAGNVANAQRQWSATTGLVIGDHNYEEQDKPQLEMDIVDEQLDTLGKAFLAQTIGCARCHDHKFDPIPTSDYYALAGILKNSISVEHDNVSKWIRMPLPLDDASESRYRQSIERRRELEHALNENRKILESANQSGRVAKASDFEGVVVDDAQARPIGAWQKSTSVPEYIDLGYLHDSNQGRGEKTITFEPNQLTPGNYIVRIAYAHGDNRSRKTLVRVASADGETDVRVNQQQPAADDGLWQTLGTFRFEAGGQAFVIVSNEGSDGHVIADAIQFLPEGSLPRKSAGDDVEDDATLANQQQAARDEKERLQSELNAVVKLLESRPMVQSLKATDNPADLAVHVRGSVHRLGALVPRGFLSCINAHERELELRTSIPPQGNGRLELARWLVDDSNPLTGRVAVNRVWSQLMGQGIVRSLDNFGTTGERPAAPELLDWLAIEFRRSEGSTKKLVKSIAVSAA